MEKITINIEGDLNIYVTESDGAPDSLCIAGEENSPMDGLEIKINAINAEALYAVPGQEPERMTALEAYQRAMLEGVDMDELEPFPVDGLLITFDSEDVCSDKSGEFFLAGDCIVLHMEDGAVGSITEAEEAEARRILKAGTAKLRKGSETILAYGL